MAAAEVLAPLRDAAAALGDAALELGGRAPAAAARRTAAALERAAAAIAELHDDALVARLSREPALLVAALAADDGAALSALAAAAEAAGAAAAAGAEADLCARLAAALLTPLVLLSGIFTVHARAGATNRLPPPTLAALERAAAAAVANATRAVERRPAPHADARGAIASRAVRLAGQLVVVSSPLPRAEALLGAAFARGPALRALGPALHALADLYEARGGALPAAEAHGAQAELTACYGALRATMPVRGFFQPAAAAAAARFSLAQLRRGAAALAATDVASPAFAPLTDVCLAASAVLQLVGNGYGGRAGRPPAWAAPTLVAAGVAAAAAARALGAAAATRSGAGRTEALGHALVFGERVLFSAENLLLGADLPGAHVTAAVAAVGAAAAAVGAALAAFLGNARLGAATRRAAGALAGAAPDAPLAELLARLAPPHDASPAAVVALAAILDAVPALPPGGSWAARDSGAIWGASLAALSAMLGVRGRGPPAAALPPGPPALVADPAAEGARAFAALAQLAARGAPGHLVGATLFRVHEVAVLQRALNAGWTHPADGAARAVAVAAGGAALRAMLASEARSACDARTTPADTSTAVFLAQLQLAAVPGLDAPGAPHGVRLAWAVGGVALAADALARACDLARAEPGQRSLIATRCFTQAAEMLAQLEEVDVERGGLARALAASGCCRLAARYCADTGAPGGPGAADALLGACWSWAAPGVGAAGRRAAARRRAAEIRAWSRLPAAAAAAAFSRLADEFEALEAPLREQLDAEWEAEATRAAAARAAAALLGCSNLLCRATAGLRRADAKPLFPAKRCSKCLVARYCSAECQAADWRAGHRRVCGVLVAERAAGAAG